MASTFSITAANNNISVSKQARQTNAAFTVTNNSGQALRGRATLSTTPDKAPHLAWLSIDGESERPFIIAAVEQYKVTINVPADAAPGNYTFRLNMVATHDPDETFSEGPTVTIAVPEAAPPSRKFPLWIIPVIVAVLAVIALLVFLLTRPKTVGVPDVVGLSQAEATAELERVGLRIGRILPETSASTPNGRVVRSEPAAGSNVAKDAAVDLYVSSGLAATPTATATTVPTTTPTPSPTPSRTPTPTPAPPVLCTGQTPTGSTAWQQYNPNTVLLDVDTSPCNLSGTPIYFTSIGGQSNHWATTGATSIYDVRATGFRVYVYYDSPITPEAANGWGWTISWLALPTNYRHEDVCVGQTPPSVTTWAPYGSQLVLTVDTSGCNFDEEPIYITSLGGASNHWRTTGATSIYEAGPDSFKVYINSQLGSITPAQANVNRWHINWLAVRRDVHLSTVCSGHTATGSTTWQTYNSVGVLLDIDTAACGFSSAPLYFGAITGRSNHWLTTGASSIYSPSATSFRVYIRDWGGNLTPQLANDRAWAMNWLALPVTR